MFSDWEGADNSWQRKHDYYTDMKTRLGSDWTWEFNPHLEEWLGTHRSTLRWTMLDLSLSPLAGIRERVVNALLDAIEDHVRGKVVVDIKRNKGDMYDVSVIRS